MKEKLKNVGEKFKGFWSGITKTLRIIIICATALIIVGAVCLTVLLNSSSSSDYIVLFPGMSTEESTEVYLELQSRGVSTKVNEDGEILVKKSEWDTLVYELADLGYPQSAPSYGTFFDNLSMTMTEFEKQQTLRFELQNRLQTTLQRIDGIKGAVVTINVPEASKYAWKETDEKASASVTLTLNNSAGFTPANVSAVKKLVAYSAQQMTPDDVTVIDSTTGNELLDSETVAAQQEGSGNNLNDEDKTEYVNALINKYEENAYRILSPIYGEDGVVAVANVTVDYDKITQEVKELLTNEDGEGVKKTEHVGFDTDSTVGEGGIVGEEDNDDIPNYQYKDDDLNTNDANSYERDTEWDIGYSLTQIEKAQGAIKDATISVVVTTPNAYLSRNDRDGIILLVKNATNISEENISVFSRASNVLPVDGDINNGDDNNNIFNNKKMLIIIGLCGLILILIILLIIFLIVRSMKKKMAKQQEEHEATVSDLQETIEENKKKTLAEAAEEHTQKEKATENEVREFVKNNPEITAALIRSMLKEEDE